jgi:hypothetical protein
MKDERLEEMPFIYQPIIANLNIYIGYIYIYIYIERLEEMPFIYQPIIVILCFGR